MVRLFFIPSDEVIKISLKIPRRGVSREDAVSVIPSRDLALSFNPGR